MYKQRLQVFVLLCVLVISACVVRLIYLQFTKVDNFRSQIEQMRILAPMQLETIRGTILDRNGKAVALDKPVFYLQINYELTRLLDDRFWEGNILAQMDKGLTSDEANQKLNGIYADDYARLRNVIKESVRLRGTTSEIESSIQKINNRVWNMRTFFAWSQSCPKSELKKQFNNTAVPYRKALEEFQNKFPNQEDRLRLTSKIDLAEMHINHTLIELRSTEELLAAQSQFSDTASVEIIPEAKRVYPYGSTACQVIGWVGPISWKSNDNTLAKGSSPKFRKDIVGKNGVEKVCEKILHGQQGKVTYTADGERIEHLGRPAKFGEDITLSLDIELQRSIESYLGDPNSNPNSNSEIGAVVIDVKTGDILSAVSVPTYDLNSIRQEYDYIRDADGMPLVSKAIYELYPPGSVIKPFILIAGMEEGKIEQYEIINCPFKRPSRSWPSCLLFRRGSCHDWRWADEGGNIARNAIKGSCNIFFSVLANNLESDILQKWLYNFGFGRKILLAPTFDRSSILSTSTELTNINIRQSAGQISTKIPKTVTSKFEELPKLAKYERRMFGIGQSSLRANVLQIANAMAIIARGGVFENPRLFVGEMASDSQKQSLSISEDTLAVVRDGMHAVVNERGGTAYNAFRNSLLETSDMRIYGKTGSTEKPYNAWFAGWAEDDFDKAISFAIVVKGGQSGSEDAAPLAEAIIRLCTEAGYIGSSLRANSP